MSAGSAFPYLACVVIGLAVACGTPAPETPTPSPSPASTATFAPPASPTSVPTIVATLPLPEPSPLPTVRPSAGPASPTVVRATATDTPLFPSPSPTLTATPTLIQSTAAPIPDGRYGGTLRLAGRERITHFDVHQDVSPALSTWGPGIAYSRLLRFPYGPEVALPSLDVVCELCSGWEMPDERTFVFHLRDDVRWQDVQPTFGRKLRADDILFSYERQRQAGWPNASILGGIESMEILGPSSLQITLAAPDADFLLSLADGHSKIVAREAVDVNGDLKDGPTVGTGPWIWKSTQSDGSHTFERNPDYFEAGLPFVDKLEIHVIADPFTRNAAFQVGLVDIIDLDPQQRADMMRENSDARFLLAREPGTGLEVALKTTAAPFDNLDVRKAVFQAMDPWAAIQEVWMGAAFVSLGLPGVRPDWFLGDEDMRRYFDHPDLARYLLKGTGIESPVPVTVKVGNFGDSYLKHANRIAQELERAGFDPTLEVVNRRVFGDDVWLKGNYQMFVGPIAPMASPNGYLLSVLHSRGVWNTSGYADPELDRLIEVQAIEYDPATRRELALEIQRRVFDKAYRFMPATRISIWTWLPSVRNFHPNFAGFEYGHWARVWISG